MLESFPINCVMPSPEIQRDERATRLSFGEKVEFLQTVAFVLCQTLVQLGEVKAVQNKHTQ